MTSASRKAHKQNLACKALTVVIDFNSLINCPLQPKTLMYKVDEFDFKYFFLNFLIYLLNIF